MAKTLPLKILTVGIRNAAGNAVDTIMSSDWMERLENGRPLAQIGAHCKGYNENSIGICLIGRREFTPAQLVSLRKLIGSYRKLFPGSEVFGHYELCRYKSCPNFNVTDWYYGGIFKQI